MITFLEALEAQKTDDMTVKKVEYDHGSAYVVYNNGRGITKIEVELEYNEKFPGHVEIDGTADLEVLNVIGQAITMFQYENRNTPLDNKKMKASSDNTVCVGAPKRNMDTVVCVGYNRSMASKSAQYEMRNGVICEKNPEPKHIKTIIDCVNCGYVLPEGDWGKGSPCPKCYREAFFAGGTIPYLHERPLEVEPIDLEGVKQRYLKIGTWAGCKEESLEDIPKLIKEIERLRIGTQKGEK